LLLLALLEGGSGGGGMEGFPFADAVLISPVREVFVRGEVGLLELAVVFEHLDSGWTADCPRVVLLRLSLGWSLNC
jgi:hypothetical protein